LLLQELFYFSSFKPLIKNKLTKHLLFSFAFIIAFFDLFSQEFTRIEDSAGISHLHIDEYIMSGGAAFFDYDNDGSLDIYVTGGSTMDRLYHNNQDETFEDVSILAGFAATDSIITNGVCTGDIDNDGDRDIFVTTGVDSPNLLFENQGDGTFINISFEAGIVEMTWSSSASMGDYNLDGYLDIYVGNYVETFNLPGVPFYQQISETIPNYFYINNGDNTFSEQGELLNSDDAGATLAVSMTDFDLDNDIDIYVANDFGAFFSPNAMLKNQYPVDTMEDVADSIGMAIEINAMGIAIGDFDEDLKFDYYVTNMDNNVLLHNDGDDSFSNVASFVNTLCDDKVSWGTFFFDFNNDSYLDLFVANGAVLMQDIYRPQPNSLFIAGSDFSYSESLDYTGQIDSAISRGAIYGDIDNDGDLDIFVVNMSDDTADDFNCYLLRNDSDNGLNWLEIKTEGTTNNFDGYGTKVILYANGLSYLREVDGGSSYESQSSSILHFGLNVDDLVDSLKVTWLGGETQTIYNISANQLIHIKEGTLYNFYNNELCFGDSFYFNNEWLTEAGIYYDTLSTSLGNDSVIIASYSFLDNFYTETEATINEGDSIYLEGEYQTTAGVYTDVFLSFEGCDSTVVTTLTVDFSSGINEENTLSYSIYPNPSKGNFTLILSEASYISSVEIYSIVGIQIAKRVFNETKNSIDFDLDDQADGIYFLHIHSKGNDVIKKIILNR
jgi:hypothetical protein